MRPRAALPRHSQGQLHAAPVRSQCAGDAALRCGAVQPGARWRSTCVTKDYAELLVVPRLEYLRLHRRWALKEQVGDLSRRDRARSTFVWRMRVLRGRCRHVLWRARSCGDVRHTMCRQLCCASTLLLLRAGGEAEGARAMPDVLVVPAGVPHALVAALPHDLLPSMAKPTLGIERAAAHKRRATCNVMRNMQRAA